MDYRYRAGWNAAIREYENYLEKVKEDQFNKALSDMVEKGLEEETSPEGEGRPLARREDV